METKRPRIIPAHEKIGGCIDPPFSFFFVVYTRSLAVNLIYVHSICYSIVERERNKETIMNVGSNCSRRAGGFLRRKEMRDKLKLK